MEKQLKKIVIWRVNESTPTPQQMQLFFYTDKSMLLKVFYEDARVDVEEASSTCVSLDEKSWKLLLDELYQAELAFLRGDGDGGKQSPEGRILFNNPV